MDILSQLKHATFGAELEIADVDTRLPLPKGNSWNRKDSTICNSSGAGNDPIKILNKYGSEINTKPCNSPEELLAEVRKIYKGFPKYSFNYTTNLHVHIRIPGLKDDLPALKRIVQYLAGHASNMFYLIDPIDMPIRKAETDKQFKGAIKRYRRRLISHHHQVSLDVYGALLKAKTLVAFRKMHRLSPKGNLLPPALTVRAAVNLLQLQETDTIEFRCFTMSDNRTKLLSAFKWPLLFCEAALQPDGSGLAPREILKVNKLKFQKVLPYNYDLDWIFQLTNLRHNSRAQAAANYNELLKKGVLKKSDLI